MKWKFHCQEAISLNLKSLEDKKQMIGKKYFCFNIREFEVLLSAFRINSLPRFKYEGQLSSQDAQQEYNVGVFELYKSGAVSQENGYWKVDEEIGRIFKILKATKYYIAIISNREEIPEYLLYVSGKQQFVVAQPGSQKGDYVKMRLYSYEELSVFLSESGALMSDVFINDFADEQELLPLENKAQDFIDKDAEPDEAELLQLQGVETVITITKRDLQEKIAIIGTLKQTLQDKLILWTKHGKKVDLYSNKKITALIKSVCEEEKDDIG